MNDVGEPVHPFALGVAVIVAVIGAAVVLVPAKLAMLPVPLAARPIAVLLFVHAYVVPVTAPANVTAVVFAPLHTVWLDTAATVGVGLTVIVNVIGVPKHVTPPLV